jgi:hypothetical protein
MWGSLRWGSNLTAGHHSLCAGASGFLGF